MVVCSVHRHPATFVPASAVSQKQATLFRVGQAFRLPGRGQSAGETPALPMMRLF
jgi:hypothetical protein